MCGEAEADAGLIVRVGDVVAVKQLIGLVEEDPVRQPGFGAEPREALRRVEVVLALLGRGESGQVDNDAAEAVLDEACEERGIRWVARGGNERTAQPSRDT
ncbi:MAG TPA: hypothetical protein VMM79_19350 [Longimicrobiales bacterium]|nr:hypothetical protein [Longimicrobiales bacterium]